MIIEEVIKELRNGKRIRRKDWEDNAYLKLINTHLMADDWEVVTEVLTTPEAVEAMKKGKWFRHSNGLGAGYTLTADHKFVVCDNEILFRLESWVEIFAKWTWVETDAPSTQNQ